MPPKDPKYEYVRVRTRKEKEKERERDARSVAESSVTTIRDRKHRNSFTSNHGSSIETSTQISTATYQDVALEQLPALPETEESEGTSTTTSPLVRTSSNVSNPTSRSSPPTVSTPARLQPYLESEADTSSTVGGTRPISSSQEWIGPRVDAALPLDDSDSMTPTPRPKKNPLESAGNALPKERSDPDHKQQHPKSHGNDVDNQGRLITDTNAMVYSWAGSDGRHEQHLYPAEMANPFLPPEHTFTAQKKSTSPETVPKKPAAPEPPTRRSPPPARLNNRAQERLEPRSQQRADYHTPARIEAPSPASSGPPMTEMGMLSAFPWPIAPAPSPIPMHHTQSNPLPYPSGPPIIDHPAHILHRIGSVLPDIGALMDLYQSTCGILIARDRQINDLQSQKAAEADHQNKRIERLTTEIESLLARHASELKRLNESVSSWEHESKNLQEDLTQEKSLRDEMRTANANLKAKNEEMKRKHQQKLEEMKTKFSSEIHRLNTRHSEEQRDLTERAKGVEADLISKIAELEQRHELDSQAAASLNEKMADMERRHKSENQANDDRWQRHLRSIMESHAAVCHDMESAARDKERALEDERRNYSRARDGWDKEREALRSHWDEERSNLQKAAEEKHHALSNKHQMEIDDLQQSTECVLSRQKAEAEDTVLSIQKERDNLQQTLDRTHAHYKSEIQTAMDNFIREKESYCKTTETAFSSQQAELYEAVQKLQREKEELLRSRGSSLTRQPNDAHETTSSSPKDHEILRAEKAADTAKTQKTTATENTDSRSSTPAPKEDRHRIPRASGIYGSGANLKSKGAIFEQSTKAGESRRSEECQRGHAKESHR